MPAENLIVVEDEPLIAVMIESLAQDLGWIVDGTALTETDALALLQSSNPKLALLDINLGPTTSLDVAATCRARNIPIVFLTGYTARDIPLQCGNAPVVTKPFTADELNQAISRALDDA